jgi:hypothetical protein
MIAFSNNLPDTRERVQLLLAEYSRTLILFRDPTRSEPLRSDPQHIEPKHPYVENDEVEQTNREQRHYQEPQTLLAPQSFGTELQDLKAGWPASKNLIQAL